MFLDLNPGVKGSLVVVRVNRNWVLGDDGTVIDPLVNEVHGHPRDLDSGPQRLTHGIHPRERGQERRVDIDDSVGKTGDCLGPENSHEPGQHQGLDASGLGNIANLLRKPSSVTTVRNHCGRD